MILNKVTTENLFSAFSDRILILYSYTGLLVFYTPTIFKSYIITFRLIDDESTLHWKQNTNLVLIALKVGTASVV